MKPELLEYAVKNLHAINEDEYDYKYNQIIRGSLISLCLMICSKIN